MRFSGQRKEEPCESYAGNICSGFGGKTICLMCGWDRWAHNKDRFAQFNKLLKSEGEDLEK